MKRLKTKATPTNSTLMYETQRRMIALLLPPNSNVYIHLSYIILL